MIPALRVAITFPEELDRQSSVAVESSQRPFWELLLLAKHHNPTVARYAETLLKPNGEIDLSREPVDPFESLSILHTLDSFISGSLAV